MAVWHTDRLFRQPRDLETLIDLADAGFIVLSSHGRYDLSNPDDRFILRIEVAHAARSSDDTSRRIKRRFAAKREQGVAHPGGPRRFGWPGKDRTWTPDRASPKRIGRWCRLTWWSVSGRRCAIAPTPSWPG